MCAICFDACDLLHLGLNILAQSFELIHVSGGGRPVDTKAFRLIWFRDLVRG